MAEIKVEVYSDVDQYRTGEGYYSDDDDDALPRLTMKMNKLWKEIMRTLTYQGTTLLLLTLTAFFVYVYRITNLQSGKEYIGRKYFTQRRKPRRWETQGYD